MGNHLKMEYNSAREPLTISEYGRSVQELVEHARKIENVEEKQKFFDEVVELILRMKVNGKKSSEYKEKVWRHVFKIAEYDMEGIVMPNGEVPVAKAENFKPPKVEYPAIEKKFRHYGHNVQSLIKEACKMEAGPKRDEFIIVIASFMKLAYKTWNAEHYMNDSMIRLDLESLSGGVLSLPADVSLENIGGGMDKPGSTSAAFRKKKKSYLTQSNPKNKKKRKR